MSPKDLLLALTVVFIAAITSAWMRGLDIRCGCFGAASTAPLAYDLVFDVVLGGGLFWLWRGEGRAESPRKV